MNPLEELRQLAAAVAAATNLEALRPVFYRIESISKEHSADPDVQALSAQVKEQLVRRANAFRTATVTGTSPAVTERPAAGPAAPSSPPAAFSLTAPVGPAPTSQTPIQSAPTSAPPPPPRPSPPPRPKAKSGVAPNWKLTILVGAGVGLCLFGGALWFLLKGRSAPSAPAGSTIAVRIVSDPAGALIRVDDNLVGKAPLDASLRLGTHEVSALLSGYEMALRTVEAGPKLGPTLTLKLVPQHQSVSVYTDLESGKVDMDGKPLGDLVDGQFFLPEALSGQHTLSVQGPQTSLSFSFEITPGSRPGVTGSIQAQNALGVVISSGAGSAMAYSSKLNLPVSEADHQLGSIGAEGLSLSQLSAGDHTLTVGTGGDAKNIIANLGTGPKLVAFLKRDVEAGTLVVVTGEDDATVFLNGKPLARKTRSGRLRIPFLGVRSYRVKVAKDGFEAPAEQTVNVRKGDETKVAFVLKPVVTEATLVARGLPEGTELWVGGQKVATAGADGQVRATVEAGSRNVELRKEGYGQVQIQKQFSAGGTVELTAAETAMKPLLAKVSLVRSPANADIRVKRQDEGSFRLVRENNLSLPAGSYTFVASAPDHQQRTETVHINQGEAKSIDLTLAKITAAVSRPLGLDAFEDAGQWHRSADWTTREGGGFSLFGPRPLRGTVVFTATRQKGKELRWVVDFRDEQNYLLFSLDDKQFRATQVRGGKESELKKTPHKIANTTYFTVSIEVTPNYVIHRVFEKNQWRMLDSLEEKNTDLTAGRFGFYLPGSDAIGVRNFRFSPSGR